MIISFYNVGGTPGPGPTPTPTGDTATTALLNSIIDGSVTDLHIGTGCTSVRDYAFSGCTDLTSVTMDSVTGIGVGSFINCSGITTVEFSENLSTIGEGAFNKNGDVNMTFNHLIFHNPVPPTVSGQAFYTEEHGIIDCPGTALSAYTEWLYTYNNQIGGLGNFVINYNTPYSFVYKTSTGEVVVPQSIVPTENFYMTEHVSGDENPTDGCMAFASALTSTPTAFLSGSTELTHVNFNEALTGIGANSFTDCEGLIFVDFGGAQTIGDEAFSGCSALRTMVFNTSTPPTVGTDAFDGLPNNGRIICPASAVTAYQTWVSENNLYGWLVNNWARLDEIDNRIAFDAIAWTTDYNFGEDRFVSEISGQTLEEMGWFDADKPEYGWAGDHRWNGENYAQTFDHQYVEHPTPEEAAEDPEMEPWLEVTEAPDVPRVTLPRVKITVGNTTYDTYMLDLASMSSYTPLYPAATDSSWYTVTNEEGEDTYRGSVLVHLVEEPGQ